MSDPLHADEIDWGPLTAEPVKPGLMPHSCRAEDLLAADVVALETRVLELTADLTTYKEMLSRALDAVQVLVKQRTDLRAEFRRVNDQYRHLRVQVMSK